MDYAILDADLFNRCTVFVGRVLFYFCRMLLQLPSHLSMVIRVYRMKQTVSIKVSDTFISPGKRSV